MLIAVYELRNNRSIGHVGGDVSPNHMDAELFVRCGKWLLSELVRVFSTGSVEEAHSIVEGITQREYPMVWVDGDNRRVLKASMSASDKALVLLYSCEHDVTAKTLAGWANYSELSRFRDDIIGAFHREAFVHFDRASDIVTLLPPGFRTVEERGLLRS